MKITTKVLFVSLWVSAVWTVSSVSYQRVTWEFLPTRNLIGNNLTSECSNWYSLVKGISSVTNTRHRSHGHYLRATCKFSSKSLTVKGSFFACVSKSRSCKSYFLNFSSIFDHLGCQLLSHLKYIMFLYQNFQFSEIMTSFFQRHRI